MGWQQIGKYEYEFDSNGYTGWYRRIGGRLAWYLAELELYH
jgi:hypothetical protein